VPWRLTLQHCVPGNTEDFERCAAEEREGADRERWEGPGERE
jgi:hypothetical protein